MADAYTHPDTPDQARHLLSVQEVRPHSRPFTLVLAVVRRAGHWRRVAHRRLTRWRLRLELWRELRRTALRRAWKGQWRP
jgi:hypothetical protein